MNKSRTAPTQTLASGARAWAWPLRIPAYDRGDALTAAEQRILIYGFSGAMRTERKASVILNQLAGVGRLLTPINDALAVVDGEGGCGDRVKVILLHQCARQETSFWAWDDTVWREMIGTSQRSLALANHVITCAGGEREALIAVAYLLQCLNDTSCFKGLKRAALAEKVFGKDHVTATLKRVTDIAAKWGYRSSNKLLMSMVAELLLMNRQPDLESLTAELIEEARVRWCDSIPRSCLFFLLTRALTGLGIVLDEPKVRDTVDREFMHAAGIANIASDWVTMVEQWEATSTLTARSRRQFRSRILKAGRWMKDRHPEITRADQWTRETAAEYVAAVDRMRVGDYVWNTAVLSGKSGKPIAARSKKALLDSMRCFFADAQEWEWIPRRFDSSRAFATPRSVKSLIGPSPRTIADDLWAKLLWAGLNLTLSDLPLHGSAASGSDNLHGSRRCTGGYYPLEMMRALSIVWLFAGLRSDEIVRLRVGCARKEPLAGNLGEHCWMLDVPVHKTGTAFSKPIDAVVGEAVLTWERVRPVQPLAVDNKTGEQVEFLFSYRAKMIPHNYLNRHLIPTLCRKAGIPAADARGQISSHRARSTIASQLFNAREPMTLFELQAWLGHRSPVTTQHYVAFTPTKLAKAYSEAQYFQRNLRMMEVLIDRQAIDERSTDQPWRYYDLGHGLCSYEFFDQCPHRMACARCDFYVPKESTRAELLASKAGMIRMLQEIPLTDEERDAVDGDQEAVERLLRRLDATPAPDGSIRPKR
ncbi:MULTISPECIES: tyrosine-type recombinase/integrase [Paraburkholderia]|uniref:Phage integrase family protein n=1 Tax=Paraburkholderia dioscoreae TaxID=2604047 RepID=A0A5Q4ZRE2_9BURK|nr:tyrosine-type recombinase/integrase [Paraburkholderia dioscoreae]VVD33780.1 Phage integrase family protein [Paraburkholderia dioscoreae]